MMKKRDREIKKRLVLLVISIFLFSVFLVSAQEEYVPEYNFCCEKTTAGAWCQNVNDQALCDGDFGIVPTSCESTSFCKMGCCIDSQEGICMGNSPRKLCVGEDETAGSWVDDAECNVPQCESACCILGDQASFVTLTRCKKMSGFYGLEVDFRKEITDEFECSAVAYLQDKGACVYEFETSKTCKFTTRAECDSMTAGGEVIDKPKFYSNYLCTAEALATDCAQTTKTMCVDGKDEVYFRDTCGNPANIYDSTKKDNKQYWETVISNPAQICGSDSTNGNAGSRSCGNCDFFAGSICSKGGNSIYGDNFCRDLGCKVLIIQDDGSKQEVDKQNGESWCEFQQTSETLEGTDGTENRLQVPAGTDVVGSRYFRHICLHGEEIIEPCADFRNEICIEAGFVDQDNVPIMKDDGSQFKEAACRVNRWKDCVDQTEQDDCENTDKRDCYWQTEQKTSWDEKEWFLWAEKEETSIIAPSKCLPKHPPGLKFWSESGDAEGICSVGNFQCEVTYEGKLWGGASDLEGEKKKDWKRFWQTGKKCEHNCQCLDESWAKSINQMCRSLGDCGAYVNIAGKGSIKGAEWISVTGKKELEDNFIDKPGLIYGEWEKGM